MWICALWLFSKFWIFSSSESPKNTFIWNVFSLHFWFQHFGFSMFYSIIKTCLKKQQQSFGLFLAQWPIAVKSLATNLTVLTWVCLHKHTDLFKAPHHIAIRNKHCCFIIHTLTCQIKVHKLKNKMDTSLGNLDIRFFFISVLFIIWTWQIHEWEDISKPSKNANMLIKSVKIQSA